MGSSYLTNPIEFLINTLFGLYVLAIMLRTLLALVRADFYNPVSQFLVKITNPLLVPMRRVLPSVGKIDTSAIVLMLAVLLVAGRVDHKGDETVVLADSLWTWDHLYPIVGSHKGPIFEGYTAMAAVATMTERASIGLLVGANTFRNPALVAKMISTLDVISDGRAELGIGAGWKEDEYRAYGYDFPPAAGRIDQLA